ncbi:glycerol dehydrogenase [Paenibacillus glufosinatiresistens]|uniref:glycerol dehydrogenase n=1 Tax=Paenibacillus glufosinatiresistens TaxID=3070657 RepID=UPI00286E9CFA|nr:glycerol dehydrogenase [Paenibacillus sp. YX.27]
MAYLLKSPSRYIQGPGVMDRLPGLCTQLGGARAAVLVDGFIWERHGERLEELFKNGGLPVQVEAYRGECTEARVKEYAGRLGIRDGRTLLVGIGGGKTLDAAKAAAHFTGCPLIVAPTAASTDAPCSALSVLYQENGELDRYLELDRSPDIVLADSEFIVQAPARMLAAGMGDALSTFYEARACRRSAEQTAAASRLTGPDTGPEAGDGPAAPERTAPSLSAYLLAEGCLRTVLGYGEQAFCDARAGRLTDAVEHIIEANIYMSGIGFESGGLAAAHAVHNGLTVLEETGSVMHGEKVAYATAVQLCLEEAPEAEIRQIQAFCRKVGLPVTLRELGLSADRPDRLALAAEASCASGSPMAHMPFAVTPDKVLSAMLAADRLGGQDALS